MPITSRDPFITELRKRLGLPSHVTSFDLRVRMNEAVSVRCTYYPDPEKSDAVVEQQFTLEPIAQEPT